MKLTAIQQADRFELNQQATKGEGRVIRSHVKVRFCQNAFDQETRQSWINGQEDTVPDVVAIRQVDAGNAEYVTEETSKSEAKKSDLPSKEDQKESKQASKDAAPPNKAKVEEK